MMSFINWALNVSLYKAVSGDCYFVMMVHEAVQVLPSGFIADSQTVQNQSGFISAWRFTQAICVAAGSSFITSDEITLC